MKEEILEDFIVSISPKDSKSTIHTLLAAARANADLAAYTGIAQVYKHQLSGHDGAFLQGVILGFILGKYENLPVTEQSMKNAIDLISRVKGENVIDFEKLAAEARMKKL
jgi:BarA-like signal transduction histidine kinase